MTTNIDSATEMEFFSSFEEIGTHWIWRGPALLKINPIMRIKGDIRAASWVGWEIDNNKRVPVGYILQRTCELKTCVNPEHRELVKKNEEGTREEVTSVQLPTM